MWLVLVPGSKDAIKGEAQRTLLVAKISKRFARITWVLLIILIVTGMANALWYLPASSATLYGSYLMIAMIALTMLLIILLYGPGRHYGRMIARFARDGDLEGLRRTRRKSTAVSYANLFIMVLITIIAVLM